MTLVELLVAATVMSIGVAMFITILGSVQVGVIRQERRSQSVDQARLAVENIDREIRSGNKLYDPATEQPGGFEGDVLRVYTQTNGNTRTPSNQCIRWRVKNRVLERQAYYVSGGSPVIVSPWSTVAEGIVNRDLATPTFQTTPDGRLLTVTLLVNPALGEWDGSKTQTLTTSIAIRNSATGDPCTPTPGW